MESREAMARQRSKKSTESNVFKALAHPLRMNLLAILSERRASPTELADELGEPLGNVAYHVKMLEQLDCIELVGTTPRRGAVEHFYRATVRPFLTEEEWATLPESSRRSISSTRLREIWSDAAAAVESNTFDSRTDRHLSWTNLVLDDKGWRDLTDLLAETLDRALALQSEVAARLDGDSAESTVNAKLVLMHYEAAPPPEKRPPARGGRRKRTRAS
jgi:DNA-binding transcriptional ArsR family regulator